MSETNVKEVVKERYGKAVKEALGGSKSSCCGSGRGTAVSCCDDPISDNLYDIGQMSQIPEEAVLASFGCGNPTALAELKAGEVVLDLGSGGGIAARGGYRFPGSWYFGGSYEFSKQDPSQLYRLAILQQLRAEGRYYIVTSRATEPYLSASAGAFAYGNAWSVDVWGPMASLGAGVELTL